MVKNVIHTLIFHKLKLFSEKKFCMKGKKEIIFLVICSHNFIFLIDYQSTRRADCRNKKGERQRRKSLFWLVVLHTIGFHKCFNNGNNHVMSIKSRKFNAVLWNGSWCDFIRFICFLYKLFQELYFLPRKKSLLFRSSHIFVFWYFGHFSCVIFFPFSSRLAQFALQNVNKDYVIFS